MYGVDQLVPGQVQPLGGGLEVGIQLVGGAAMLEVTGDARRQMHPEDPRPLGLSGVHECPQQLGHTERLGQRLLKLA